MLVKPVSFSELFLLETLLSLDIGVLVRSPKAERFGRIFLFPKTTWDAFAVTEPAESSLIAVEFTIKEDLSVESETVGSFSLELFSFNIYLSEKIFR